MSALAPPVMAYSWQQQQWRQLQDLIENERMPHALLLSGFGGIGKGQFARALAQRLLCESPDVDSACGRCKQCQLFAAGSHPDFRVLEPESPGKAIKIDSVREVGDFVTKTAQQGGWRIVVIHSAEAMNTHAANALLKSLEEPGQNVLLILVSGQLERIMPTVRSRCRILKFPLPSENEASQWLEQVIGKSQQIPALLELAGNRPLQALTLFETETLEKHKQFVVLLEGVASGSEAPLKAAEWCKPYDLPELIDWFQLHVYERIKTNNKEKAPCLLFRFIDRLNTMKRYLQSSSNPNLQLLWEELFIDWQALFSVRSR